MSKQSLSTVATDLIETYGNTARNVIQAYRAGSDRMVGFLEQRWEHALEQSAPQLSAETQRNARNAQQVFGSYYTRGVDFTSNGAETVVTGFVRLAGQGVQQAAANAHLFQTRTGTQALEQIAQAAVPAVVAVSKIAAQIEQKSGELVERIAGETAAPRATAFRKARARKAA